MKHKNIYNIVNLHLVVCSLAPAPEARCGCVRDVVGEGVGSVRVVGRPAAGQDWLGLQVERFARTAPGLGRGGRLGVGVVVVLAFASQRPLAALAPWLAVAFGARRYDLDAAGPGHIQGFHLAVVLLHDFVFDFLAFFETAEPFRLDRRLVHEHVFAAVRRRDEAEPFVIEP